MTDTPAQMLSERIDWLLGICDAAGKGCLPPNVDARSVKAVVTTLQERVRQLENELAYHPSEIGWKNLLARAEAAEKALVELRAGKKSECLHVWKPFVGSWGGLNAPDDECQMCGATRRTRLYEGT